MVSFNDRSKPVHSSLYKQSPAFGLPQIKEYTQVFIDKANEVCSFVQLLRCYLRSL